MTARDELDLTELRRTWDARREALRGIRGGSPFVEDAACGAAARAYYERKYRR